MVKLLKFLDRQTARHIFRSSHVVGANAFFMEKFVRVRVNQCLSSMCCKSLKKIVGAFLEIF